MGDVDRERAEKVAIAALLVGVVFILAGLRQPLTLLTGVLLATAGALIAASGGLRRGRRITVTAALLMASAFGAGTAFVDFWESWQASQLLERGASVELMRSELRRIASWSRIVHVGGVVSAAAVAGIALVQLLGTRQKIEPQK